MFAERKVIDELFETKNVEHLYGLSRAQFLLLFRIAEGRDYYAIAEELEKNKRTLYDWRTLIIKKFKVNTFDQVMYVFGKILG